MAQFSQELLLMTYSPSSHILKLKYSSAQRRTWETQAIRTLDFFRSIDSEREGRLERWYRGLDNQPHMWLTLVCSSALLYDPLSNSWEYKCEVAPEHYQVCPPRPPTHMEKNLAKAWRKILCEGDRRNRGAALSRDSTISPPQEI